SLHRAQSLADCRARYSLETVLVGYDLQPVAEDVQQLARCQQEIRIARTFEALVALRKGLEDQHASIVQCFDEPWEMRAVEVVRHDDAVEAARAQRPVACFKVELEDLETVRRAQLVQSGNVDVHG